MPTLRTILPISITSHSITDEFLSAPSPPETRPLPEPEDAYPCSPIRSWNDVQVVRPSLDRDFYLLFELKVVTTTRSRGVYTPLVRASATDYVIEPSVSDRTTDHIRHFATTLAASSFTIAPVYTEHGA
jgi:hypothetical protein